MGPSLLLFIMFEKWTKRVASKAADSAVDGVKETLNDKLETYSGIIKIGLTLAVIIFGSIKINDHATKQQQKFSGRDQNNYGLPQQPIIINNYISDGRRIPYGQEQSYKKN